MIDIHTHILPNIDDGSKSVECSNQMLSALKEDGVSDVVFTPHFYWEHRTVDDFLEKRESAANKINFEGLNFHYGAEVEFGELKIDYSSLSRLCIDQTRYILLELPFTESWSNKLFDNIYSLIQNTDVLPVIAHIERYPAANKKPKNIETLLTIGCLLQMNANTIISVKPGSLADVLLKNRQIQAVGTDCHNMAERKPRYGDAISKIAENYGGNYADYMQACMNRILSDERVNVPYIHHIKKGLVSYR